MNLKERQGLTLIYTGEGKGKTTAALGLLLRAWGNGLRVGCIQFIKSPERVVGERVALEKIGVPLMTAGKGFIFDPCDRDEHYAAAQEAWELARREIMSGNYDLLVLDEITYLLNFGWIETDHFVAWLKENKPKNLHLVLTGRDAPEALINYADTVSEVREVKHHYHAGIEAQSGIEF